MIVDSDALQRHIDDIQSDDEGWFVWDDFNRLLVTYHLQHATHDGSTAAALYRPLRATQNRLTDLRTIVAKLRWMRDVRDAGQLDGMAWSFFCTSDVMAFFTNVRGLFDHLGELYQAASTHPGNAPTSFRKLRERLAGPESPLHGNLPPGIPALMLASDWFPQVRDIRDGLVHRGAQTLVFPGEAPICFQVYGGGAVLPHDAALMFNANVVNFQRLAGAVLARVHALVNDSAAIIASELGLEEDGLPGWSRHWGLGEVRNWTADLLAALP